MSVLYRHRQSATAILLSLLLTAPVVLVVVVLSLQSPINLTAIAVVGGAVLALLAGTGWYFSSMTIEVTDDELRWRFGLGGYYRIARSEIESVAPAKHSPFWGYGIRWIGPKRWAYIVSGRDAVDVRLRDGGYRRLGTNDRDELMKVLTSTRRR
jgi:hypothetical protein